MLQERFALGLTGNSSTICKMVAALLVLLVTIPMIQRNSAQACFHELSTNSLTRHINYTGNVCRWTVVAPESHRIVLTLLFFDVERQDKSCTVHLNVYDEKSAAAPICPGFVGSNDYVSEGNKVHLNVTNMSRKPVMASLEATFRGAEEYFSCNFNAVAPCTGQVADRSSWLHSTKGNDICLGLTAVESLRSGIFYQGAFSTESLRLPLLSPGKYVFNAEIITTCSSSPDFRQFIFLSFCNITRSYSLQNFYHDWSTFFELVECNSDFEVTVYSSAGAMVVAMDNIRLMKVIDEIHLVSTVPTSTTSAVVTEYYNGPSGFQQRRLLTCVCSAIILLLVLFGVGYLLVYKRTRKVNEMPETPMKVTFDNRTYDNDNTQTTTDMQQHYDAVGSNGYSVTNESEYQAVNDTNTTEGYHYIRHDAPLGYESMLPGVPGQQLNHSDNIYVLENGKQLEVEDGTYYITTENEYQDMSRPNSEKI